MIDIPEASAAVLSEVGFATALIPVGDRQAVVFEDATVLGFLFAYDDARELIEAWSKDANQVLSAYQFGLRRAGEKAWNTYVVLLAAQAANFAQIVALSAIEEDLAGTRKIAHAGLADVADLRTALLPLMPLQSAPRLEAVDVLQEIRQRSTELPARAIEAFLSNADESMVIQVLEERP